jgi:hypothetical protein
MYYIQGVLVLHELDIRCFACTQFLPQRSIFTQVAVLQGGVCKMGDRSFICILTLKVIAVLHTCIHTKTSVSLEKSLNLHDFDIRDSF